MATSQSSHGAQQDSQARAWQKKFSRPTTSGHFLYVRGRLYRSHERSEEESKKRILLCGRKAVGLSSPVFTFFSQRASLHESYLWRYVSCCSNTVFAELITRKNQSHNRLLKRNETFSCFPVIEASKCRKWATVRSPRNAAVQHV